VRRAKCSRSRSLSRVSPRPLPASRARAGIPDQAGARTQFWPNEPNLPAPPTVKTAKPLAGTKTCTSSSLPARPGPPAFHARHSRSGRDGRAFWPNEASACSDEPDLVAAAHPARRVALGAWPCSHICSV
jgi:hypothetical protein